MSGNPINAKKGKNSSGRGVVVIGSQYGDEGKAKIVDVLSEKADYVVRYQGGANAGHTVIVGNEEFKFHLVPSGILYPHTSCILGIGMAIDPVALKEEIKMLDSKGIDVGGRLFIDPNAHIVLDKHIQESKNENGTGRGIAPCYADKARKKGLRFYDILNLKEILCGIKDIKARHNLVKYYEFLKDNRDLIKYIKQTSLLLGDARKNGKNILFECAQGTGLDIDHGQYPETTSSNPTIGGVFTGTGISHKLIDTIIGVTKAYVTRVDANGAGPLVTRADKEMEEKLRSVGGEYGVTTGRNRRCGWFDVPLVKHAIRINGIDRLILTKLDVLSGFSKIPICTHYDYGHGLTDFYVADALTLRKAKPAYEYLEGFEEDISSARILSDLPKNARKYHARLEEILEIPMDISVGPERNQIILNYDYWG